ncbi:ATP dependent DNA ligase domain protein [Penicillium hispanicum]|uniref:ATP dependent DNA ligase domain protein n=1 Tax=Penicillium hispanicum TaxID=1080232 RepID=UPI0025421AAC|nr:ATP dependent DNA ligase domain protein [Penicillium hispanicum]KAJ5586700.1 ATP dependent DNA ligase domain protein [Penicillium hispanicum]
MLLEDQRFIHEDLERLEQAIADRVAEKPANIRERLARDHELAKLLIRIEEQSKRLLEIYKDADGLREKEVQAISTGDQFEEFYKQLDEIKDFHKRYPNEPVENLERAYKRRQPGEGEVPGMEIDNMFTGEEGFGQFLDLTALHEQYLNLPGVKRLSYIQYLEIFDVLTPPTLPIKRKDKLSDKYFRYVSELSSYLEDFIKRVKPLENLDTLFGGFDEEFEKQWAAKEVPGWTEEKTENGTSGPMTEGSGEGTWCPDCEKEFKNDNVYRNHLAGKKHIRAAEARKAAGSSGERPSAPAGATSSIARGLKERAVAEREHRVRCLAKHLQEERGATRRNVERRQGMTGRERQMDLEALLAETEATGEGLAGDQSDEEEGDRLYNPLNLPLAWDGKPIPYWLYKLHGLGVEYPCEICGNYVYMGRRAFDKHFSEAPHIYGLKCLGITSNTNLFREITRIEDAMRLWEKLEQDRKKERESRDNVVQMEDAEGNVMPERIYLESVLSRVQLISTDANYLQPPKAGYPLSKCLFFFQRSQCGLGVLILQQKLGSLANSMALLISPSQREDITKMKNNVHLLLYAYISSHVLSCSMGLKIGPLAYSRVTHPTFYSEGRWFLSHICFGSASVEEDSIGSIRPYVTSALSPMGFKFAFLCDLLSSLEANATAKAATAAHKDGPDYRTIAQWVSRHQRHIHHPDTDRLALLSCMFPEKRTDRVYWLGATSLARVIGRCLGLGSSRLSELDRWRFSGGPDLGHCVERVMCQTENYVPGGREVLVEEIDQALNLLASRCRFSGPQVRRQHTAVDVDGALSPLYRRLSSRDAKWLTRMILKSYSPVVLPQAYTLDKFHFLLPHLLQFQDTFEGALNMLASEPINHFPPHPDPKLASNLCSIALEHLCPRLGIKVGRPDYFKARSTKHCALMAKNRRMSIERKYDGEYCQIHIDLTNKRTPVQIFSKSGRDSTEDRCGIVDIVEDSLQLKREQCKFKKRCILEGELLVWSDKYGGIVGFHKLRKFLSRSGTYLGIDSDSP